MPWPAVVGVALTVALIAAAVYVGLGFLEGDTDRYGRVAVPGTEALELGSGEVDIFYAEDISLRENESLTVPGGLTLRIQAPEGQPSEIRRRSGQEISGSGGTATLIGSLDVPEEGTYEITTRGRSARERRTPEVTFGTSPFDAVVDRAENVLGIVIGPIGLGALAIIVLVPFVGWVRRRSTVSGPTLPPDGGY